MLKSDLISAKRVRRAVDYIDFKAISSLGEITEQSVLDHFGTKDDAQAALQRASQ